MAYAMRIACLTIRVDRAAANSLKVILMFMGLKSASNLRKLGYDLLIGFITVMEKGAIISERGADEPRWGKRIVDRRRLGHCCSKC